MTKLTKTNSQDIAILRIIACLGVFSIHYCQQITLPNCISDITKNGQDGLWLFYILSGFLTTYSYANKNGTEKRVTKGGVYKFYVSRFLRIVPLAYTWLLVIYFVAVFVFKNLDGCSVEWVRSILYLNMVWPSSDYNAWNSMYVWGTLSNFVLFYLIFPLLYKYGKGIKHSLIVLALSMLMRYLSEYYVGDLFLRWAGGNANILQRHWFGAIFWYFSLGMTLFWIFNAKQQKNSLFFIILAYCATLKYEVFNTFQTGLFLLGIVAVVLCIQRERKPHQWMFMVERYTFPLFICHMLVFKLIKYYGFLYKWGSGTIALFCLFFPILFAIILYHLICVPTKRLSNRLLIQEKDKKENLIST